MEIRTINSLQNPLIKNLVHLRQNHDYRKEHKSVCVSGIKLVTEISAILPLKALLVTDRALIPKGIAQENVFLVTEEIMKKASGLQHPEGVLAEFEMPEFSNLKGKKKIIALDKIADPGNLGTILRTALAFGFDGAFLIEGTTDPFNDKALSAARGASFKLSLGSGNWRDLMRIIEENALVALAADLEGQDFNLVSPQEKLLLVLGNEAHGISQEVKNYCQKITIPMSNQMESLNVAVAAGILMHRFK